MGHTRWTFWVLSLCLLLWPQLGHAAPADTSSSRMRRSPPPDVGQGEEAFYIATSDDPSLVLRRGIYASIVPTSLVWYETILREVDGSFAIVAHQHPINAARAFRRGFSEGSRATRGFIYQFRRGADVLELEPGAEPHTQDSAFSIAAGWSVDRLVSYAELPRSRELRTSVNLPSVVERLNWRRPEPLTSECRLVWRAGRGGPTWARD